MEVKVVSEYIKYMYYIQFTFTDKYLFLSRQKVETDIMRQLWAIQEEFQYS